MQLRSHSRNREPERSPSPTQRILKLLDDKDQFAYLSEIQMQYRKRMQDIRTDRNYEIKKKSIALQDRGELGEERFPHFIESFTFEEKTQKCFDIYTRFLEKNYHDLMKIIEKMEDDESPCSFDI